MSSCTKLTSDISFQQRVLHIIAKDIWGTLILRDDIRDKLSVKCEKENLIAHRDSVINKFPDILNGLLKKLSAKNPKLLIRKILNAVFNLQHGYYEALIWEDKYNASLPLTILNPETAENYHASNFIDPNGHFNELAWVELFVSDERMDEILRFEMACFYCLQDKLTQIWKSLKEKGVFACGHFLKILHSLHCTNDLVVLWSYKLNNTFEEFRRKNQLYASEFNTASLYEAVFFGHDNAAYFFWAQCTLSQQKEFLDDFDLDYIYKAAEDNYSKVVHFLYSLLSSKHEKTLVFVDLFKSARMARIWACLLQSQFSQCTLNDILNFPESIPMVVYSRILDLLISNIQEFNYSFMKAIFKKLWNHLTTLEGSQDFETSTCLVSNFVELKEIDLIETIIAPWPIPVKEKMLLDDWLNAGRSAVDEISKTCDYETMLHYFVSFLMVRDFSAQRLSLRSDKSLFLERLKQGKLLNWKGIDEKIKKEALDVFGILEGTLSFLDSVKEKLLQGKRLQAEIQQFAN